MPGALFLAAYKALTQWRFRPYLRDGKPDVYAADITFDVGGLTEHRAEIEDRRQD